MTGEPGTQGDSAPRLVPRRHERWRTVRLALASAVSAAVVLAIPAFPEPPVLGFIQILGLIVWTSVTASLLVELRPYVAGPLRLDRAGFRTGRLGRPVPWSDVVALELVPGPPAAVGYRLAGRVYPVGWDGLVADEFVVEPADLGRLMGTYLNASRAG